MPAIFFIPYLCHKGGAEKWALEYLKRTKYDYEIHSLIYDEQNTFGEFQDFEVKSYFDKRWRDRVFSRYYGRIMLSYSLGLAVKVPNLNDYDFMLVSDVGMGSEIAVRNHIPNRTFMHCHSILRSAGAWYDLQFVFRYRKKSKYEVVLHKLMRTGYNMLEKIIYKNYSFATFHSELVRQRALEKGLFKPEQTAVIPSGVEFSFDEQEPIPELEGVEFVVYPSRYTDMKRQPELVMAWKKFKQKCDNELHLVIVGQPFRRDIFLRTKKLAKGRKDIHILGFQSRKRLNWLYKNCQAGMFLGYYEDFGLVPLEILGAGKTLLGVDSGGYMEYVYNAPSLIVIPERVDREQFVNYVAEALVKFYRKRDYYIENAKKNEEFIRKSGLTWDNFVERMDKTIGERL